MMNRWGCSIDDDNKNSCLREVSQTTRLYVIYWEPRVKDIIERRGGEHHYTMSSKVELAMSKVRPEDLKACQDSMRKGSKSFYLASALLPASVRPAITIYYAWCRSMDDAIDEAKDIDTAKNNLKAEEKRLDDIFSKDPESFSDPVDRAFSTLVQTADLPKSYAVHLWEGNLWDCEGRR